MQVDDRRARLRRRDAVGDDLVDGDGNSGLPLTRPGAVERRFDPDFGHGPSPQAFGQLSLIQRPRLSSLTSPAARAKTIAAASASGTTKLTPLMPRKV